MGDNKVILQGNLTRNPELRCTPNGMAVCEFTVAVNGTRKDDERLALAAAKEIKK